MVHKLLHFGFLGCSLRLNGLHEVLHFGDIGLGNGLGRLADKHFALGINDAVSITRGDVEPGITTQQQGEACSTCHTP